MRLAPPRHVVGFVHHHQVFSKTDYRDPTVRKHPAPTGRWEYAAAEFVANGLLHVGKRLVSGAEANKTLWQAHCAATPTSQQMLAYRGHLAPPNLLAVSEKAGALWLHQLPTEAAWTGYPKRRGFDVAPLLPGRPVRVALNARWWHSIASRRETRYFEWDFVVEYLGQFEEYELSATPQLASLDVAGIKLIDLRKELY